MTKLSYTIFNILALTAIIYIGIDAFYRIVREQLQQINTEKIQIQSHVDSRGKVTSRFADYQTIMDRNIFHTTRKEAVNPAPQKIEALEPTSLNIALIGTIAGDRANSAAIIEETGKRSQGLYHVGDSIQNAVLKTILRGKVVLRVGDRDEILVMEEPGSAGRDQGGRRAETPSNAEKLSALIPRNLPARTITVSRSDIDEALADINHLLSQASIRPHFTDGEADGLAVTGIRAGSIFRKMGLRNGDIVQGVNGNEIQSPDDLISLYNDLTSESEVSLQIKRRGRERTLNYRFRE